ncbi:HugZ family pyridoxamine 5'-phosphate oxidase [Paracoccus aminophilus]|uniref:Pyridoxamine 5'-phosphate oxidase n=1 Tax=Paracoccus aminophilus JCM 7686 TaxID=1367847 RepID=S5XX90_PARAH|nr:pyridoxamine 5'-phosphate oxidase family protein [Paracoccus aminophilus]AGT08045.1 pyridoxamine 5'-phosphate oxidase [Paracoccus aminophilus JCM 7686]
MTAITPRGLEINLDAARPMEPAQVARQMLLTSRVAALATLDPGGFPYNTATNLVVRADGTPLIFTASLALHARNIEADPRVSLSLADHGRDVLVTPRLSLSGRMERVTGPTIDAAKDLYLRRFPKAKLYLSLPDARIYQMKIEAVQLNGGPAQNANDVTPDHLRLDLSGAEALMAEEAAIVEALNGNPAHVARIAKAAGVTEDGRWSVTGIDPEGVTLNGRAEAARWWFGARLTSRARIEAALAALG